MGKTAAGALWLNNDRLSRYDYWQFWRNTDDADVVRFLKLFTDLFMDEIEQLGQAKGAELNCVKERLAHEATSLAHGVDAAKEVAFTARRTFEHGEAAQGLPTLQLEEEERSRGVALVDLLVRTGLSASKSEARRAIAGRGVRIDGEVIEDPDLVVLVQAASVRLSLGRKRHAVVK